MIWIVSVLLVLSLAVNAVAIARFVRLGRTFLEHERNLERCLDDIDASYRRVSAIVELPLATNDPRVVQIHRELQGVRQGLHSLAYRLSSAWNEDRGGKQDQPGA